MLRTRLGILICTIVDEQLHFLLLPVHDALCIANSLSRVILD
jgi:hypothetical protein